MQGSRATLVAARHLPPVQGTVAMAPARSAPRMSQFVIALWSWRDRPRKEERHEREEKKRGRAPV